MTVDNGLLEQLEALGKLSLNEAERERFANDLNEILGYIGTLSALDVGGEDSVCPETAGARLRADEAESFGNPEKLLENAETENGCFAVPRAVE